MAVGPGEEGRGRLGLAGRWVPGASWEPGPLARTSAEATAGGRPPLRPATQADDMQRPILGHKRNFQRLLTSAGLILLSCNILLIILIVMIFIK